MQLEGERRRILGKNLCIVSEPTTVLIWVDKQEQRSVSMIDIE